MKNKKTKIILICTLILLLTLLIILLMQRKSRNLSRVEGMSAQATVYTRIGEQEFDITNLIEQNQIPMISAGMIPIKWNGENWVITTVDDNDWYSYKNKKPAFMMLNDGVYQSEEYYQMPKTKKLAEENIGAQISADDTDTLGSIYMWVPRFAYSEDENAEEKIVYLKNGCTVAGSFTMPDIFQSLIGENKFELSGMWVEVKELESESVLQNKVAALNKGEEDIIYGFLAHTKASSMTEEGKVAMQKYAENMDANYYDDSYTTTNHTILKIVDLNSCDTELIVGSAQYNYSTKKIDITVSYSKNPIAKIINSKGEILSENSNTADSGNEIIGNKEYVFYVVDNQGNIKTIKIKISGLAVYIIPDLETLVSFKNAVNGGQTYENSTVYQVADITIPYSWTSIGSNASVQFKGTYDGGGYTISGLNINSTADYQGFFGYCTGKVKNLKVTGSVKGARYVGRNCRLFINHSKSFKLPF